jgi:lysozyme
MNTFHGIIDIYQENKIDFDLAWQAGVRAIIHKASEGSNHSDQQYATRKEAALKRGFLWGAYHLSSHEDVEGQFKHFLSVEDGSNPNVLLALDWEKSADEGIMSLDQVREYVRLFSERFPNRYPILYGGWILRETPAVLNGDPILAKCPLWYQRYKSTPAGIPTKTWPHYTFWQFDNEQKINGASTVPGLDGEDWNRFAGTEDQLRKGWPFAMPADSASSALIAVAAATPPTPGTAPVAVSAAAPTRPTTPSSALSIASAAKVGDYASLWTGKRGAQAHVKCIGIRGGYEPGGGKNKLGIYDDKFVLLIGNEPTEWKGSTDPGQFFIGHPENPRGCAQLREGIHMFKLGLHQQQYPAFVQAEDFHVNRLDHHGNVLFSEFGEFAIHLHSGGPGINVNQYSAGCQVIASPEGYFGETWHRFFDPAAQAMRANTQSLFPYMLIDASNVS